MKQNKHVLYQFSDSKTSNGKIKSIHTSTFENECSIAAITNTVVIKLETKIVSQKMHWLKITQERYCINQTRDELKHASRRKTHHALQHASRRKARDAGHTRPDARRAMSCNTRPDAKRMMPCITRPVARRAMPCNTRPDARRTRRHANRSCLTYAMTYDLA